MICMSTGMAMARGGGGGVGGTGDENTELALEEKGEWKTGSQK